MDIVTLGAALNGSAEYVNSHFKGGSNIQIVDNPDGTQTINASGEVSAEDTVAREAIVEHVLDKANPHEVTASQVGLGNVNNTSDIDKPVSTAMQTALNAKANTTDVYSKNEVDTALSSKQNVITDLADIRSGATLGSTAVQPVSGKGLSTNDYTTTEKNKLAGIAEGAEVNEIESIKVNNTTINPDANKVVNITIPTTAADVSALPDTTKYAVALSLTINSSTFVMTGQLKDQNGDNLGTAQTIDLPLESVVVGGSYNSQTKKVVLTLQNGNTIEFSVADLVSGLQTELSTSNKLNPAFIEYDSTHRAVSDTEKSMWNSKQSALNTSQLDAVNSGIDSTKVEQIETNENNILYNTNQGVKNIFRTPTIDITSSGINVKTLSDGQLKVTSAGTNTSAVYIDLETSIGSKYVGYKLSGGSANVGVYISNSGGTVACSVRGDEVLIPSNATNKLFLTINANTPAFEETIYVMIRESGDSTYQPYAISNAKLTYNISLLTPQIVSTDITELAAESYADGTVCGYANSFAGLSAVWLVIRTYTLNREGTRKIQIMEAHTGERKTKFYNGSWGTWS